MKLEWEKISEEKFNTGKTRWRNIVSKVFALPNGKKMEYDIKDEHDSVVILALTPQNKVVLEKIFSPGIEKVLTEMPAGFVEKDEAPEMSAKRELLEETGMEGQLEYAGGSLDDGYSNASRYVYVAKNCKQLKRPKLEDDEIFEIVEMDIEEFRKHLRSGLITHAESGYIALDYLGLL